MNTEQKKSLVLLVVIGTVVLGAVVVWHSIETFSPWFPRLVAVLIYVALGLGMAGVLKMIWTNSLASEARFTGEDAVMSHAMLIFLWPLALVFGGIALVVRGIVELVL